MDLTMNSNYPAQPTAQGLASLGRDQDTMLMHVTPNEVAGLQQLAMAQGGSLTINPHTGLPEAGFFNDLLGFAAPIAAGFALGPAGFGLFSSPLTAGLAVGGVTALASGDIMKGLSAGLGAYGGAGLGSNLGKYGAEVAKTPVVAPAANIATPGITQGADAVSTLASQAGTAAPPHLFSNTVAPVSGISDIGSTAFFKGTPSSAAQLASNTGGGYFPGKNILPASGFDNVKTGVGNIFSPKEGSLSYTDFLEANKQSIYPDLITVGAPFAQAALNQPVPQLNAYQEETSEYGGPYVPSDRSVSMPTDEEKRTLGSKEYTYFSPTNPVPGYRPVTQYAYGGEVEYEDNPIGYANGGETSVSAAAPVTTPAPVAPRAMEKRYNFGTPPSSLIPSTEFDDQLTNWNTQYKNLTTPKQVASMGGKGGSMGGMGGFMGNSNPGGFMGYSNPYSNNWNWGQQTRMVPGMSAAQAIAKIGAKPVWTPPTSRPSFSNYYVLPTTRASMARGRERLYQFADGGEIPTIPNVGEPNYGINQLGNIAGTNNRDLFLNNGEINPVVAKLLESVLQDNPNAFANDATPTPSVNEGPKYMPEATQASIASPMAREQKQFTDIPKVNAATGGIIALSQGGKPTPGGYLDGQGDGMSDSIHATIANKQPARLADGEFVVPADVVSHIGNGSSKAGAKRLYSMMSKIRQARTGTAKQGKQINPNKYLPA
jgi:hypothetical protein